jgi:polysaccharide biosynthesis PFTS motif protein
MMVHKRKRNIGKLIHPQYEALVSSLAESCGVVSIDPNISAIRVIESCSAVISMPFTSTALLGRDMGKPSVYYDPHGVVQKDDRAAHGIEILSGSGELRDWLAGLPQLSGENLLYSKA